MPAFTGDVESSAAESRDRRLLERTRSGFLKYLVPEPSNILVSLFKKLKRFLVYCCKEHRKHRQSVGRSGWSKYGAMPCGGFGMHDDAGTATCVGITPRRGRPT